MIKQLGGQDTVKRHAPAARMLELPDNSLYLQATETPLLLKTEGYRRKLADLHEYLPPVIAPNYEDLIDNAK